MANYVRSLHERAVQAEAERDALKGEIETLKEQNDHLKAFLVTDW